MFLHHTAPKKYFIIFLFNILKVFTVSELFYETDEALKKLFKNKKKSCEKDLFSEKNIHQTTPNKNILYVFF